MAGVPKLKGKGTYARWCFAMTSYLRKAKTWEVVSGDAPRPDPFVDAASNSDDPPDDSSDSLAPVTAWEERNDAARYDIIATLSEEQLNKVVELGYEATAKEVWDFLARENAPTGDVGKQVLLGQLYNSRYVDGTDMDAHLVRMRQLASQLAAVGEPISDATFGVLVKGSLPSPSWDTVTFLLDGETLDRETLCTRLVTHAERRKVQQQQQSSSSSRNAAALSAQDSSKDQCYNCKGVGHHANACPKPATPETLAARQRAKNRRGRNSARRATPSQPNNSSNSSTFVLSARVHEESWAMLVHKAIEKWIVDSGAGRHITGCLRALSDYIEEPLSIDVADNRKVISPGYGSLKLKTGDGDTIVLRKVRYLPGAGIGLLSVGALGDDASVIFKKRLATVSINGRVIFRTLPGTPYILDATIIFPESDAESTPESTMALATRDSKAASLMTWHRRLGHVAPSTILQLAKQNAVEGLKLSDSKIEDCESCILAKSKKSPFSATSSSVKRPLARVFIDLGFPKVADSKGRDLYLVIADQHSAARWSYPLASKDAETVLAVFKDWHVAAEKISGQSLARVRSDNGSEFVNAIFKSYFKEHGITHETTAPYTPEQNGQVERMNGTLMAATKALLHESGFDKSEWPLALAVATYTGNRTAHPRLEGVTPYEAFTGKKPYIGHLRPFGAVAFAHVDRSQRAKLDDTAVKGRLIGYSGDYNYEIRLDSGKIITTRHATFGRLESSALDDSFVVPPSSLDLPPVQPSPAQSPPAVPEPEVRRQQDSPPQQEQYEYRLVKSGPNPGQFENIDPANIIEGRRTRGHLVLDSQESIFARLAIVADDEPASQDDVWEEVPVFIGVAMPDVPRTYQEAMASPFRAEWIRAMQAEWDAFESHKVLSPAKLPVGAKALGTTWVFTIKTNLDGTRRFKARLVAQGFAQRPGIDVNETFAPVARSPTIRYIVAFAAAKNLALTHFDFDTAFLNGRMTEDVFIRAPQGYPHSLSPGLVLKLDGAMYGTKQAPREWHRALESLMTRLGYRRSTSDVCVFVKTVKASLVVIAIYVDDGLIAAASEEVIAKELQELNAAYKLKILGPVSNFLSMQIEHYADGIFLHHAKYVRSILERFGFVTPSRSNASTPMDERRAADISPPFDDVTLYQSAVGALMFTATYVRPSRPRRRGSRGCAEGHLAVGGRLARRQAHLPLPCEHSRLRHLLQTQLPARHRRLLGRLVGRRPRDSSFRRWVRDSHRRRSRQLAFSPAEPCRHVDYGVGASCRLGGNEGGPFDSQARRRSRRTARRTDDHLRRQPSRDRYRLEPSFSRQDQALRRRAALCSRTRRSRRSLALVHLDERHGRRLAHKAALEGQV